LQDILSWVKTKLLIGKLNGLGYQNSLITDIHTIVSIAQLPCLATREMARSRRKVGWISSAVPAVQCMVLGPGYEVHWKSL